MSEIRRVCIYIGRHYNIDIEYVSLDIYGYSTRDVFRVELSRSTSQLAIL